MRKTWPTSLVSKCLQPLSSGRKLSLLLSRVRIPSWHGLPHHFTSWSLNNQSLKHPTIYFRSFLDLNYLRSRTLSPLRSVYNIFKVLKMVNYSDVVRKYSLQNVNHMQGPSPASGRPTPTRAPSSSLLYALCHVSEKCEEPSSAVFFGSQAQQTLKVSLKGLQGNLILKPSWRTWWTR